MTTPKARYVGDDTGHLISDFPQALRKSLRQLIVDHKSGKRGTQGKPLFTAEQIGEYRDFVQGFEAVRRPPVADGWRQAHPADEIVEQLLSAAYPSKVNLYRYRNFALKKGELLAEHADLLTTLRTTKKKLRLISAELDRLLGPGADPLGVADQLDLLLENVERATPLVQNGPARQRDRNIGGTAAADLAQAISQVLERNGLSTVVTVEIGKDSLLIAALKAIGDAMGLVLSTYAWKNHVSTARKACRAAKRDR